MQTFELWEQWDRESASIILLIFFFCLVKVPAFTAQCSL